MQSGERGTPGRARRAPCALAGTRCPALGEQEQLLALWVPRAGLGGHATLLAPAQPASRLRTSERAFVLAELAGLAAFVWAFLSSLLPSQPHSSDREVL